MQACADVTTGFKPQSGRPLLAATLILICLFLSSGANAQPASETDVSAVNVTFGGSAYYPPFHFFNDSGIADGFDVSIFNHIARSRGWTAQYRLDDWQTIQQALSDGEVDVVPMFVSAERQARYLLSSPIHVEYHLLFGAASANAYPSLEALSNERIAAEGGAFATSELRKTHPQITIVDADSEAGALTLVTQGLADLALLPSEIGRYTLRTRGLEQLAALSPPLLPVTYAFAVTPTRPELLTALNAGIEQLQRQGDLETLRNQWLYTAPVDARERALLIMSWTLPLLLVIFAAGYLIHRFYRLQLDDMRSRLAARLPAPDPVSPASEHTDTGRGTGEPAGRKQFLHQVDYEITVARHEHGKRGLALISLLHIDPLQDAFDEAAGDEMISKLAASIPEPWAENCAQLMPGVFGFLIRDINDAESALKALILHCSQPVKLRELDIHPQLCAGYSVYPEHASNATDLLHKARIAMNYANRAGLSLMAYNPAMKPDPRRIQIISDLRNALVQRQLQWAVQPQFDVAGGQVYGAELLARWHHPQHGWLPPADFITWAEEAGLIDQISDQVIDETAALFNLISATEDPFCLSINLSAYDLGNDALVESLIQKIRGRKPGQLTVEVTETALMANKKAALRNIDRLKMADFRVALDDYGTGYASMEYLQSFNFDEIKIDRRFINNITSVERDRKLTRASIELGHQLGATVVAEGVEDAQSASILADMGCDVLQGYFIGRPELLGDFPAIRQTWRQVAL